MGLFKKDRTVKPSGHRQEPESKSTQRESFLGDTVLLEGIIIANGPLKIAGHVKGEIQCSDHLEILSNGSVEGTIQGDHILISGAVVGNIEAKRSVTIASTGRLKGDIHTSVFTHQSGGFFEGFSHMTQGVPVESTPAASDDVAAGKKKRASKDAAKQGD
jgi:cytoskeletal protein CcmA (bactofilin family)